MSSKMKKKGKRTPVNRPCGKVGCRFGLPKTDDLPCTRRAPSPVMDFSEETLVMEDVKPRVAVERMNSANVVDYEEETQLAPEVDVEPALEELEEDINPDIHEGLSEEIVDIAVVLRVIQVVSNIDGVLPDLKAPPRIFPGGYKPISNFITWKELFDDPRAKVNIDLKKHKLVEGITNRELDINSHVYDFFDRMRIYHRPDVHIIPRPKPLKTKKGKRAGKKTSKRK